MTTLSLTGQSSRVRWAGLTGREKGDAGTGGPEIVFLHGLTFDRRMWYPVLDQLPGHVHAIAFDLPGHGGSAPLVEPGLAPVVEAVRSAVVDAGMAAPILVGHSIGGPLATIYASDYSATGVISVDAPVRLEPFVELLRSLELQLKSDSFDAIWAQFQESWGMDLVPAEARAFLHVTDHGTQKLVLDYQFDLLDRPLEEVVRWRDEGLRRIARMATPYVALAANPVGPEERAFLAERVPQAELVVWPVEHHFPHVAEPGPFADLVLRLAEGG